MQLKVPEETGEYSSASISLDYYHASADWKNVYDRIDDYYGNTGESVETPTTYGGSAYISFGKDCTHTIQTRIDCGVYYRRIGHSVPAAGIENITVMKTVRDFTTFAADCKIKMAFSDAIDFFVGGKK